MRAENTKQCCWAPIVPAPLSANYCQTPKLKPGPAFLNSHGQGPKNSPACHAALPLSPSQPTKFTRSPSWSGANAEGQRLSWAPFPRAPATPKSSFIKTATWTSSLPRTPSAWGSTWMLIMLPLPKPPNLTEKSTVPYTPMSLPKLQDAQGATKTTAPSV